VKGGQRGLFRRTRSAERLPAVSDGAMWRRGELVRRDEREFCNVKTNFERELFEKQNLKVSFLKNKIYHDK
jgi:hypothetical protein